MTTHAAGKTTAWVATTISGHLLTEGFDALRIKLESLFGSQIPALDTSNRAIIDVFALNMPQGYTKYGMLFETHWIDSSGEYVVIPRSFGSSPADSLVNESTFNQEIPSVGGAVNDSIAIAREKIAKEAEAGGTSIQSQAIWLEFDPIQRDWTIKNVSLPQAEAAAKIRINALLSNKSLASSSDDILRIRARAVAWQAISDQYRLELQQAKVLSEITNLINANQKMSKDIENAVGAMRRANDAAGFFNTINWLAEGLGFANSLKKESSVSRDSFVTLRDRQMTLVTDLGDQLIKNSIRIKEVVQKTLTGIKVATEIYTKDEIINLRKH